jgi:predicted ferric reductase
MTQVVADFSPPVGAYAEAASPSQSGTPVLQDGHSNFFRRLRRYWAGLRWYLARTVFSVPLPLLTTSLDLKLGDMIVTLPVCCACLAYNAYISAGLDVTGSGGLPAIALLIVFVLTVRNNSALVLLTGISFERALLYHKLVAVVAVLLGGLHGLAFYLDDKGISPAYTSFRRRLGRSPGSQETPQIDRSTSGIILFFLMVALLVFSLPPFRRRYYELFLRSHWLLFLAVIVFAIIHGVPQALIGAVIWFVDLLFRHSVAYLRRFGSHKASSTIGIASPDRVNARILPSDILRIEFPRESASAFRYEAGQYVFLCVPALSMLEWHPFTISSSPSDPTVTIHIKQLGDWTRKLVAYVNKHGQASGADGLKQLSSLSVLIDGAYGHPMVDIESPTAYSHFVLLSGGIGITPMLSVVNQLHHEYHDVGGRRGVLRRVHFVWAVRDQLMLDAFMNPKIGDQGQVENGLGSKFFPNRLVNQQDPSRDSVFTADIYLTKPPNERQPEASTLPSYLEWIQSNVRSNTRPDVMATLRSIGEDAKVKAAELGRRKGVRVAVLVCGPSALVDTAIKSGMKLQRELGVAFDVHTESFDF